ncbi:MAG TPA: hypothetical protein PK856_00470 [Vitreoscilla sp.]|nr:hypothetical protein [Vitreoscilla sp.]
MKGFFSWYAIALLVISTGLNYWMVIDSSRSSSGGSSIIRTGGGSFHK